MWTSGRVWSHARSCVASVLALATLLLVQNASSVFMQSEAMMPRATPTKMPFWQAPHSGSPALIHWTKLSLTVIIFGIERGLDLTSLMLFLYDLVRLKNKGEGGCSELPFGCLIRA